MDGKRKITNQRIYSFDLMRIIAVCAVIMIHTSADFVIPLKNNSFSFICGNFFDSLSRFAVPMFLMILGALMLDEYKEITTRKILKSTLNILMLLAVWSVIYSIGYNIIKPIVFDEPISISNFLAAILNGHYHMWYLFVLIGLYLVTPILRSFIKKENSKQISGYLIFSVIICFGISFLNQLVDISASQNDILLNYISKFRFDYIYEYLIYYILGWYLTNIEIKKTTGLLMYLCGVISVITTFVCTQIFFTTPEKLNNYFYSNESLNVFYIAFLYSYSYTISIKIKLLRLTNLYCYFQN